MADVESRLSPQEEKDLNKFQKFFAFKVVQVIVQARLGEKIATSSKPNAMGYDWFNLAINDIKEVLEETKKIMANNRLPSKENPLCVEVSLKTNEGNTMVLETWRLSMNEKRENTNKITYTVYNRMGVLLKSLISVSRVTPAYKIARKQGHDYILCYRIYFGQVRVAELGEGFQSVRIGTIGTPKGGLTLSVAYRTKLTLPQSQSQASDHLRSPSTCTDGCPPHHTIMTDSGMQYPVDMTAEFRHHIVKEIASAVADTDLSSSNLSPRTFNATMTSSNTPTSPTVDSFSSSSTSKPVIEVQGSVAKQSQLGRTSERPRTFSETRNQSDGNSAHGAFVSAPHTPIVGIPSLSSTPPFASLLSNQNVHSLSKKQTSRISPLAHRKAGGTEHPNDVDKGSIKSSQLALEDDFIMVELKAAFAPDPSSSDLTQFYRECQNAPPLELFDSGPAQPLRTVMNSFSNELDVFERNMKNFDQFIDQLESEKKT